MKQLDGQQLSILAEDEYLSGAERYDYCHYRQHNRSDLRKIELAWEYLEHPEKLGTNEILVPNFPDSELGTNEILVPNSQWKPPIGCIDRKWIKDHRYWCWRYYATNGKKKSIHLHKDYNKAIRKAIEIGVPTDAKTNPQAASAP